MKRSKLNYLIMKSCSIKLNWLISPLQISKSKTNKWLLAQKIKNQWPKRKQMTKIKTKKILISWWMRLEKILRKSSEYLTTKQLWKPNQELKFYRILNWDWIIKWTSWDTSMTKAIISIWNWGQKSKEEKSSRPNKPKKRLKTNAKTKRRRCSWDWKWKSRWDPRSMESQPRPGAISPKSKRLSNRRRLTLRHKISWTTWVWI